MWEYSILQWVDAGTGLVIPEWVWSAQGELVQSADLLTALNEMGSRGWELAGLEMHPGTTARYIFKRATRPAS